MIRVLEAHRMRWPHHSGGFQFGAHWGQDFWTNAPRSITLELGLWRVTLAIGSRAKGPPA